MFAFLVFLWGEAPLYLAPCAKLCPDRSGGHRPGPEGMRPLSPWLRDRGGARVRALILESPNSWPVQRDRIARMGTKMAVQVWSAGIDVGKDTLEVAVYGNRGLATQVSRDAEGLAGLVVWLRDHHVARRPSMDLPEEAALHAYQRLALS